QSGMSCVTMAPGGARPVTRTPSVERIVPSDGTRIRRPVTGGARRTGVGAGVGLCVGDGVAAGVGNGVDTASGNGVSPGSAAPTTPNPAARVPGDDVNSPLGAQSRAGMATIASAIAATAAPPAARFRVRGRRPVNLAAANRVV